MGSWRWVLVTAALAVGVGLWAAGYAAGSKAAAQVPVAVPAQAPLQELIPLPGPGQQFPGTRPQPGQGEECEARVYLFYNGRFYEMRPGPGMIGPDGRPTGPQELIPLQPAPSLPAPGLPAPRGNPFAPPVPLPPGSRS
jgi:hypothetical protein